MSMMPASRVEFKKNLTAEQVKETVDQIISITGAFNRLNPPLVNAAGMIIPTSNPQKLSQIRALPHVAKVGPQF